MMSSSKILHIGQWSYHNDNKIMYKNYKICNASVNNYERNSNEIKTV